MSVTATYAVVSRQGNDFTLFMGNGTLLSANGFTIEAAENTNAVVECKNGNYFITCEKPVTLTPRGKNKGVKINATDYTTITF